VSDRPDAAELLEAVWEFLATEVAPAAQDHRLRFRTLVAMNALGIARRELDLGAPGPPEEELRALASRIRAGDVRDGDLAWLQEHVAAKLRVSNPEYLRKYA
jgi:hypothetical protein